MVTRDHKPLSRKKLPPPDVLVSFPDELYKTYNDIILAVFHKFFQKTDKEASFANSLQVASTSHPHPKTHKKKRKKSTGEYL